MLLIPALKRQRQEDLSNFHDSLVHTASSKGLPCKSLTSEINDAISIFYQKLKNFNKHN